MKWTVIWRPLAEATLANLWMNAPDRNAVAMAADEIDSLLAKDPLKVGESRLDSLRVTFVSPLAALFEVSEPDRLVTVLKVWGMTSSN